MDTLEKLYQQFPRTPKLKIIKVDVLREGVKYTPMVLRQWSIYCKQEPSADD